MEFFANVLLKKYSDKMYVWKQNIAAFFVNGRSSSKVNVYDKEQSLEWSIHAMDYIFDMFISFPMVCNV